MKSSIKSRADVLQLLVDILNDSQSLKCKFDELHKERESLCLSTIGESKSTEVDADVTGTYVNGTLIAMIRYRVPASSISARGDLEAIGFVDNLYEKMKLACMGIDIEGFYFTNIVLMDGCKLVNVYDGGIRDFELKFSASYERKKSIA